MRQQPRLTEEQIEYNDEFYRGRLQSLQAVDEMVDGLFERLEHHGILDNTYVFYTSDNGFHIGQHRLQPGKETGYEEDIHVPLIIRGPGIAEDETSALVTAHIDLAPTFLSLAGAPLPPDLDGEPILSLSHLEDSTAATTALTKREHVNVEYWGWVMSEGKWGFNGGADRKIFNTTYKALRVVSDEYDLYYSVWCTNEHELYDMTVSMLPGSWQADDLMTYLPRPTLASFVTFSIPTSTRNTTSLGTHSTRLSPGWTRYSSSSNPARAPRAPGPGPRYTPRATLRA